MSSRNDDQEVGGAVQEAQQRAARRARHAGSSRVARLHMPGRGGVRHLGGLVVHRRRLLLLRHPVHHRVRRPGARQVVPGHGHAERAAATGRLLRLPAVRPGPDRHVVLARPGGGGVQVPARGPQRGTPQAAVRSAVRAVTVPRASVPCSRNRVFRVRRRAIENPSNPSRTTCLRPCAVPVRGRATFACPSKRKFKRVRRSIYTSRFDDIT